MRTNKACPRCYLNFSCLWSPRATVPSSLPVPALVCPRHAPGRARAGARPRLLSSNTFKKKGLYKKYYLYRTGLARSRGIAVCVEHIPPIASIVVLTTCSQLISNKLLSPKLSYLAHHTITLASKPAPGLPAARCASPRRWQEWQGRRRDPAACWPTRRPPRRRDYTTTIRNRNRCRGGDAKLI